MINRDGVSAATNRIGYVGEICAPDAIIIMETYPDLEHPTIGHVGTLLEDNATHRNSSNVQSASREFRTVYAFISSLLHNSRFHTVAYAAS